MFNIGDKVKMVDPGWAGVEEQPTEVTGKVVELVNETQFLFQPDNADFSALPIQFAFDQFELI